MQDQQQAVAEFVRIRTLVKTRPNSHEFSYDFLDVPDKSPGREIGLLSFGVFLVGRVLEVPSYEGSHQRPFRADKRNASRLKR
jgi:hypothetical protein